MGKTKKNKNYKYKTKTKKNKKVKSNVLYGGNKFIPKKIWFFWDKGIDKVPYIYKLCVQTYKNLNPTWEINILDDNNIKNYLNDDVYNMIYSKKKIRPSHKSDIIRMEPINE